jgi:hypothetical protein
MAVIIDIADAVAAAINAGTFSQSVTAEREYLPTQELAKSTGIDCDGGATGDHESDHRTEGAAARL